MPLLSLFTCYQTRSLDQNSGRLTENTDKLASWTVKDSGAARSIHLRDYRMAGQALFTAIGVGVVAVGVLGMIGILPIGSVGSIAILSAGGFIIADGLLAFIIDGTRGRLSRRFHNFAQGFEEEVTVAYQYRGKTHKITLSSYTSSRRSQVGVEVKQHLEENDFYVVGGCLTQGSDSED